MFIYKLINKQQINKQTMDNIDQHFLCQEISNYVKQRSGYLTMIVLLVVGISFGLIDDGIDIDVNDDDVVVVDDDVVVVDDYDDDDDDDDDDNVTL